MSGSEARRRSATEQHQRAIAAINAVFDRLAEMADARARVAAVASAAAGDDPLRDAEAILHGCEQLQCALDAVRSAAASAAEHRSRGDLAADIGTKTAALFPRSTAARARDGEPATRPPAAPAEAGGVSESADEGVPSPAAATTAAR